MDFFFHLLVFLSFTFEIPLRKKFLVWKFHWEFFFLRKSICGRVFWMGKNWSFSGSRGGFFTENSIWRKSVKKPPKIWISKNPTLDTNPQNYTLQKLSRFFPNLKHIFFFSWSIDEWKSLVHVFLLKINYGLELWWIMVECGIFLRGSEWFGDWERGAFWVSFFGVLWIPRRRGNFFQIISEEWFAVTLKLQIFDGNLRFFGEIARLLTNLFCFLD